MEERIDVRDLFGPLRRALVEMLDALTPSQWERRTVCDGWSVGDVASHLLGVELGNVSRRRDDHRVDPQPGDDLSGWLAAFNEAWVSACRRLSPRVVASLLDTAGAWFEEWVRELDIDAKGQPVWWAGPEPAPVWLDVAREYTERWVHQQQIREAIGSPGMADARFLAPVLATFVHALPNALRNVDRPAGTTVELVALGEGGGAWHMVRTPQRWELRSGPVASADCRIAGEASEIWRLYANYDGIHLSATGDTELAAATFNGRAIIV